MALLYEGGFKGQVQHQQGIAREGLYQPACAQAKW